MNGDEFSAYFPNGKSTLTGNPEGQIFAGFFSKSEFMGKTAIPGVRNDVYNIYIYYIYRHDYVYIYIINEKSMEIQYNGDVRRNKFWGIVWYSNPMLPPFIDRKVIINIVVGFYMSILFWGC